MFLSMIFAPVSKNGPAKIKDPGLVNMVKGGYGLYDNHRDALMLLPLGEHLLENLANELEGEFLFWKAQEVFTGIPEEGGFSIASRSLKTEDQLPLVFMETSGQELYLSCFLQEETHVEEYQEGLAGAVQEILELFGLNSHVIREHKHLEGNWEEFLSVGLATGKNSWKGEAGFYCPDCGWGGKGCSEIKNPPLNSADTEAPENLQEVHTPGADTIEELCRQLQLPPEKTLKTMFFATEGEETSRVVVALMRGDRKIHPLKLARYLGVPSVRLAAAEELHQVMGILGGYLGPRGLPEHILMVADLSVPGLTNVAVGANKPDYHCKGACWGRDFSTPHVTDLLLLEEESPCPLCGASLRQTWWREAVSLGERKDLQARCPGVDYRNGEHKKKDPRFLLARISLEQILLALFEQEGPLPPLLSPFTGYLYVAEDAEENEDAGAFLEDLSSRLLETEMSLLIDDCTEKPANREYNAQAFRFPWSLVITREGLAQGKLLLRGAEEEEFFLSPEELEEYFESFMGTDELYPE